MGVRGAALSILRAAWSAVYTDEALVVFAIGPEQLKPVTPASDGPWSAKSSDVASFETREALPARVTVELQSAPAGQWIHWIEIDGRIASWGFSTPWQGAWRLTETRSALHVPHGGVCLTAFETQPEFRGRRLYPAVLTAILRSRFGGGATRAYIWCRRQNHASYAAIKRVGFQEVAVHRYRRMLGVTRQWESPWIPEDPPSAR